MRNKMVSGVMAVAALFGGWGMSAASALEFKPNDWLEGLKLKGDIRMRGESFFKDYNQGQLDRQRLRYRLRYGAEYTLPDNVLLGFQLASGTGEQVSTNQSFDNLASQPAIWIDLAYVNWKPRDGISLSVGRMKNPFWMPYSADLVWDGDFNPMGMAESAEYLLAAANVRLFGTMLQMVADEDSGSTQEQWLFSEQIGAEVKLPAELRLRLAGSIHSWINERDGTFSQNATNEGNRRTTAGVLDNEFNVMQWDLELARYFNDIPFSLQGTYVKNLNALEQSLKEDTGYQTGLIVGKAGAKDRSWEAAYFYKHAETDCTVADVSDSDFGDGGTNREGHILWVAYSPRTWLQLKIKYFMTEVVEETLSPSKDDIDRLQLDMQVNF
ncbi:MAG: putative porin [Planctomycetota bacterium]